MRLTTTNRHKRNRTLAIQTMERRELMAADGPSFSDPIVAPEFAERSLVGVAESNDTQSGARNLGTLRRIASQAGSVGGNDPQDFFRFRVAFNGSMNIRLSGMRRDLDVLVLDSNGNQIASGVNDGTTMENVNVNLVSGRDYFLKVFPVGSGPSTSYRLSLALSPSDDAMANAASLGTFRTSLTQNGSVGGNDPVDFYRFRVSNSGSTRIQLSRLSRNVDVYVLDSSGREIGSGTRRGTNSEDFRVNLTAGRDYFIRVVPFGSSAVVSNYQLRLSR